MWNNRDRQISELDAWIPESKNAESRVSGHINADYIDERLRKFGLKEFPSFPCNGREISSSVGQGKEPHREFWLNRESQRQALPSRKLSKSVNGSHNYMGGLGFERASTCPRGGPYVNREEDLYSSQEMLPIHRSNVQAHIDLHTQQTVPHLEEELYPAMTAMMNHHQSAAYHSHGYPANILKNGMESQRAAFEGAMTKYTSDYYNSQSQNLQYEKGFMGQPDYPIRSFAGPYDHPYASFHGCNGQFSGGSYSLELSSREDGPYSFPSGPPLASQRDMSLLSTSNQCTCCKEHAHMQLPGPPRSSFWPYTSAPRGSKYPPMGYQHMQTHAHFHDSAHGRLSSSTSHNSLRKLQSLRKAADSHSQAHYAVLAKKENRPPLPGPGAPPYVLCQGCDKVIQVPAQLHVEGAVLKLRCGACRRISKFCNIVHPCYQTLLKEGSATGSMQRGYVTDSLSQQKMFSAAAPVETKQNFIIQGPLSAKSIEGFGSSCVVGGRLDKEDKENGTHDGVQNPEAFSPGMSLEGPADNEWRGGGRFRPWSISGTIHEDSSSLFSASGSLSTKNTGGVKSYESQQLDMQLNFDSQCPMSEESVEAKAPIVATDFTHEQSDTRLRISPEELQGLMLECLQESSHDDLKGEKEASIALPESNEFQYVKCVEPVTMSNHSDQEVVGLAPKEKIDHLEENEPVRVSLNSDQRLSDLLPREQTECHNSELVHGKVEVYNDGSNSAPGPGSPLYEHLSYDSASEIVEALQNKVEGKQSAGVLCVQETSKGSNFLTSFLKKSIHIGNAGQGSHKNFSVVVNGMIIPPDAVKSSEKQAGTIRPGVYWYDYQAGFWGVMGGPCLGIIPPFIEEFKRPLSKDCAGGTTGVFVNGRELHRKDLEALAGRGLPRTPGKAYMVDISGQVVDGSSGQMLRSLGRLAPTVQKRGRGCGMFQPPSLS